MDIEQKSFSAMMDQIVLHQELSYPMSFMIKKIERKGGKSN